MFWSLFWLKLPGPGRQPNEQFLAQVFFLEARAIVRVFRAIHWFSSKSGAKVMSQKPKIDKNYSPASANPGYIIPIAITRQLNELESCWNHLETREVLQFRILKKLRFGCRVFSLCLHDESQGRNQLIFSGVAKWCKLLQHLTNT